MTQSHIPLIASLVDDLRPVRPLKWRIGALLALAALALTIAVVGWSQGFRDDLLTGELSPLFVIAQGLFFLLGAAAATAVVAMANPRVGAQHDGPKWAMAAVALLPVTAILTTIAQGTEATPVLDGFIDLHCLIYGSGFSALVAATLFTWLRRGAPVSLNRAGLYLGTASGALGVFTYGLSCPLEAMNHLGIWHVVPVALLALLGRFAAPPLLRW